VLSELAVTRLLKNEPVAEPADEPEPDAEPEPVPSYTLSLASPRSKVVSMDYGAAAAVFKLSGMPRL
jgi:hypothetical protein